MLYKDHHNDAEVRLDHCRIFVYDYDSLYEELLSRIHMTTQINNYIVRSYRDVIVLTNTVTRRTSKAHSIVMH